MAITPLSDAEIDARMTKLDGWTRTDMIISKTFTLDSYLAGPALATAIGVICEGMNHHPDNLSIGYKQVEVSFTTHDVGNVLTASDFDAAEAIDALNYPRR
ncbi:MAG: 4a-hydroxytetrahydrobiopterin dehydratase [Chloroflexi bacterium]|nr:4a-hydroxytetrahydrobiopterin dehydratase [Chloroflexota bacterium]